MHYTTIGFGTAITCIAALIVNWLNYMDHIKVDNLKKKWIKFTIKTLVYLSAVTFWSPVAAWLVDSVAYDCIPRAYVEPPSGVLNTILSYSFQIVGAAIVFFISIQLLRIESFRRRFKIIIGVTLVIAFIFWTIVIRKYYDTNIKVSKESVISAKETNKLVYVDPANIIPGETVFEDRIPYWYQNYEGNAVYDYARAINSEFIPTNSQFYVEITWWTEYTVFKDIKRNTARRDDGTEHVRYKFYVPAF